MKISNFYHQLKTEKIQVRKGDSLVAAKNGADVQATPGDRVELSANIIDVQKMKEIIQESPAIREDKVAAIKARIERGEFTIDSKQLADKMLQSLLPEALSE